MSLVADACASWKSKTVSEEEARTQIAHAVHIYADSTEFDGWMRSQQASRFIFEVQDMLMRNILASGVKAKIDLNLLSAKPWAIRNWMKKYATYEIGHQLSTERKHQRILLNQYHRPPAVESGGMLVSDTVAVTRRNRRTLMSVELMHKKEIPVPAGLDPEKHGITHADAKKLIETIRDDPIKARKVLDRIVNSQYRYTLLECWNNQTIDDLREGDTKVLAAAVMLVLTPKSVMSNAIKLFNKAVNAMQEKEDRMKELDQNEIKRWLAVFTPEEIDDYVANDFSFDEAVILLEQDISGTEARQIIQDYALFANSDDDFVDL